MINDIKFFWWRFIFAWEYSKIAYNSNFSEGWRYSGSLRQDYFDEGYGAKDSLFEDMSYWDG